MAGYFGRLWPWAAIVVVVLIWLAMTPLAANPMGAVRRELGLPTRNDQKGAPRSPGPMRPSRRLVPDCVRNSWPAPASWPS